MQFTPKTERQLQEEGLFPAGVYPFEILEAADKTSKAGNEMIELKLRIFNGNQTQFVNDYLMESMGFKLFHACEEMGLMDRYESGKLPAEEFKGKTGFAKIVIKKDKNGVYPDRNNVADYVSEPGSKADSPKKDFVPPADTDDDIPFSGEAHAPR